MVDSSTEEATPEPLNILSKYERRLVQSNELVKNLKFTCKLIHQFDLQNNLNATMLVSSGWWEFVFAVYIQLNAHRSAPVNTISEDDTWTECVERGLSLRSRVVHSLSALAMMPHAHLKYSAILSSIQIIQKAVLFCVFLTLLSLNFFSLMHFYRIRIKIKDIKRNTLNAKRLRIRNSANRRTSNGTLKFLA